MAKRSLFIFGLVLLVGFLILPEICLAVDLENIDLREIGKYLGLPESRVQELIRSLIGIFQDELEDLMTARWYSPPYPTPEEMAVPSIMKKAVQVQALNHLLIDAPIQTIWAIVKNATKIARVFLAQDPSVILNELEKESVKKATEYGMNFLLQNEIRVAPGAIEFKYINRDENQREALFQYIMVYQPIDAKRGKVLIRFYSPNSLEPPQNEMSYGGVSGIYTELTTNLPPFIVDIRGTVEDYQWVGDPSIEIDFPAEVPDLGIKPLSWWEKYVLKPIETTIKEVEILVTRVTGKSPGLTDIWNEVKKFLSRITTFFPAALVQAPEVKEAPSATNEESKAESQSVTPEPQPEPKPELEPKPETKPQSQQLTLAELQEMLDDLAEKIDIFSRQVSELVESKKQQTEKEIEEDEELEEKEDAKEAGICPVNINTASAKDLQAITGVGPVLSQRIIEARPFSSVYDLKRVSGIGEITLQGIIGQSCAYVVGGTGSGSASAPVTYPKILISEIQIEGDNINYDFIELYNPNDFSATISGYKLRKRTSGGTESSVNVLPSGSIIAGKGYYLWASSKDENYPSSINADTLTTQTLAVNNSIALLAPDDTIISALAWGSSTNPFVETSPFPDNPGKNKSLGRIWDEENQTYFDTNDNSQDFEIQNPTPKAQNQSPTPQLATPPLAVVINEIAWMGTATSSNDEWIELHNTTKNEIDLTGWTLVSITDGSPDITLSRTISPLGFYLLERTASSTTDVSEDQIYTGGLNNECEILVLYDPNNNPIDQTVCREDGEKRYWPAGKASPDYITMERIDPRTSGEDSLNWANNNLAMRNGKDAGGNDINGTPKAQNSVYQSLPPEAVADLTIDSQNSFSNKVKLTWSTSTDPDTLSEDLSYQIYYLKESLNKDNLESASTSSTTATTITISDLDYNSTYYFGIKTFDDWNYSSLATTTPYQTATLATIASGFSVNDLNPDNMKNNGRKIARASNGDLYVVYSRNGKIFLAKSTEQGIDWTEIEVTPQETLEQINPSIAIDSQDNLYLVWQGKATTSAPYQIRYAKYDGTSFSEIEDLTENSGWEQEIPVIAIDSQDIDSQDNVHVVWVNKQQSSDGDNNLVSAPQLLHRVFTNQWETIEKVAEIYKGGFSSLALAIDSQDNLHLISRESRFWDTGGEKKIQYRKRTTSGWEDIRQLASDDLQDDFPSLAVDSQDNLHLVWYRTYFNESRSEIKYLKYTASTGSWGEIETLDRNEFTGQWVIASPSIALDSQGHLYVIWKRWNEKISLKEYSDSWAEVKNLELGSLNSFAFNNFLWSFYPIVEEKKTNQPTTGYAFIFYEGTELKFYASQDLNFE